MKPKAFTSEAAEVRMQELISRAREVRAVYTTYSRSETGGEESFEGIATAFTVSVGPSITTPSVGIIDDLTSVAVSLSRLVHHAVLINMYWNVSGDAHACAAYSSSPAAAAGPPLPRHKIVRHAHYFDPNEGEYLGRFAHNCLYNVVDATQAPNPDFVSFNWIRPRPPSREHHPVARVGKKLPGM